MPDVIGTLLEESHTTVTKVRTCLVMVNSSLQSVPSSEYAVYWGNMFENPHYSCPVTLYTSTWYNIETEKCEHAWII